MYNLFDRIAGVTLAIAALSVLFIAIVTGVWLVSHLAPPPAPAPSVGKCVYIITKSNQEWVCSRVYPNENIPVIPVPTFGQGQHA